jgi:hypothetical protein
MSHATAFVASTYEGGCFTASYIRIRSAKQHAQKPCLPHQQDIIPYVVEISVLRSWRWANVCPKHVELIFEINKTVIVASSWCSIFTLPKLMMNGQTQINFTSQVYWTVPQKYGPCGSLDVAGSPHEIFNIFFFFFFFFYLTCVLRRWGNINSADQIQCFALCNSTFLYYNHAFRSTIFIRPTHPPFRTKSQPICPI